MEKTISGLWNENKLFQKDALKQGSLKTEFIPNFLIENISGRGFILSRESRLLFINHTVAVQPEVKTIPL